MVTPTNSNQNAYPTLAGRHAVVTGGGQGIGAAVAERLDALGAKLTLMDLSAEPMTERCKRLTQAQAIQVNVTDPAAVESGFAQAETAFGPVDILVNCAGRAVSAPFARTSDEDWHSMLDVNLTGSFYCVRAVLPAMTKAKWGRIITIASTAGLIGYAYVAAYCAAKHGVVGMTRALALETAQKGVTVNAVCPGYTNTELLSRSLDNVMEKTGCTREEAEQQFKQANPQNRFIEPYEIATTVTWLCLPGSESVTGQALAIAGGEVM